MTDLGKQVKQIKATAFERGRKAGLEEAIEVVKEHWDAELSDTTLIKRLRARLTQGTDKGLERK
jgi:hypothetical protein